MIIAVDFDGTCVKHRFPLIGQGIGAEPYLKMMVERGHKLILFTVRSGKFLDDAVKWFEINEIPLYSIQTNPNQRLISSSPKVLANLYIDDLALGCPVLKDELGLFYVDWPKLWEIFNEQFDKRHQNHG